MKKYLILATLMSIGFSVVAATEYNEKMAGKLNGMSNDELFSFAEDINRAYETMVPIDLDSSTKITSVKMVPGKRKIKYEIEIDRSVYFWELDEVTGFKDGVKMISIKNRCSDRNSLTFLSGGFILEDVYRDQEDNFLFGFQMDVNDCK